MLEQNMKYEIIHDGMKKIEIFQCKACGAKYRVEDHYSILTFIVGMILMIIYSLFMPQTTESMTMRFFFELPKTFLFLLPRFTVIILYFYHPIILLKMKLIKLIPLDMNSKDNL